MINQLNQDLIFGATKKVFSISQLKIHIADDCKNDITFTKTKTYFLQYFAKSIDNMYYKFETQNDGMIFNHPFKELDYIFNQLENFYMYDNHSIKLRFSLKEWFTKHHDTHYKINNDPRSSRFYDNPETDEKFINLSKGFLHKIIKPFNTYSQKVQEDVNKIISHIKNVWNSGIHDNSEYCLNFLAHALTGHKMQTALILKSGEGTGKSIIIDFIIKHVIGESLGLCTPRAQQLTRFNSQLMGKIFVCLEELAASSKNDWHSLSDIIKDLITGSKLDIEKKYSDVVQTINLLSLIILTNNDNTLKFGKEIRRYMLCDVSHDQVGNSKYFDELIKVCTLETGEAFFMWLTERYEATKFTFDEAQIPLTYAKMEMKERNMTPILKYIKSEYVSKKLGLFDKSKKHGMIKLNDMKDNVNGDFSQNQSTQAFHNILKSDIPIVKIMKYGKNKDLFIEPVDYDTLKKWYVNKGFWCEDFDQYTKDDNELEVNNFKAEIYFEKDTKIKEQSEKIKELEQYIIMMENKYKIQQEPIIIEEIKQEPIIIEEIKQEVIIPVPKKQSSKKVIVKTKITKTEKVTEVPKAKKETPKKKIVHMHMIDETDDEHYSDADNINDLF